MFCVTERKTKRARVGGGSREWFLVVTDSARRDLFSGWRFTAWRVAGVTLVMGGDARGNPERSGAPAAATVAGRTPACRPRRARQVLRVIEFDVEALIELRGKSFHGRI